MKTKTAGPPPALNSPEVWQGHSAVQLEGGRWDWGRINQGGWSDPCPGAACRRRRSSETLPGRATGTCRHRPATALCLTEQDFSRPWFSLRCRVAGSRLFHHPFCSPPALVLACKRFPCDTLPRVMTRVFALLPDSKGHR